MIKKVVLFCWVFIFNLNLIDELKSEIYIHVKVDDEIITNYDLKKESEYLKILNPNLNQISDVEILNLAKRSLIKEIIKRKEIEKFKTLDSDNSFIDN